ncbi:hypothetical protein P168DRAFT_300309 [Aspergillus campestris IBT 28561]|uniref:Checkpoint protein RAD24-like helical bundle domain-containing protein n=1 Tax=Aspergillus campestris (strain IBT 28561) TaxID=1392248 RepID=A0A2I1CRE2_ASPC2|nr:uncharacterized protein P168DRAFT_300309 [Aspergillus campestris IBT 28561]PKY00192.1 hypothetical protein P168DRAFT_300309 [Aspergillus campestris IBT 28561]
MIEDDYDSFDELFTQHFLDDPVTIQKPSEVQTRSQVPHRPASSKQKHKNPPNSTKRFIITPDSISQNQDTSTSSLESEQLPWAQQYPPLSLDELAVHSKKVSTVQNWLYSAFAGNNNNRLLVLRGPAGSGKTTTVSLLSDKLEFEVVEWKNPPASEFSKKGYVSFATQFDEFLQRGNQYQELDLDGARPSIWRQSDSNSRHDSLTPTNPVRKRDTQRVILIEEFPTTFFREVSSLTAFRRALQQYLAMPVSLVPRHGSFGINNTPALPPIIIIVSENDLNSGYSTAESLTAHRLLGPQILNHPSTTLLDFNKVAPTFMNKALQLVLEKDARFSKREKTPGPAVLQDISKTGDIRSAIASLEFLCLRCSNGVHWTRPATKKKTRIPKDVSLTSSERDILALISQRETSLGIFHAVGKVVYNKREDPSLTDSPKPPTPPAYMLHHERPKISQVSVNDLIDEAGTDAQTFISTLHENYVLSCNGPSFTDYLDGCMEALSDSDLLSVGRRGSRKPHVSNFAGTNANVGVDALRQNEISYQVAARGILFALPYPVKRQLSTRVGTVKRDPHRMFFSPALRCARSAEETQSFVDMWANKLLNRSVEPTRSPGLRNRSASDKAQTDRESAVCNRGDMQDFATTMIARNELLLDQLPYMAKICVDKTEQRGLKELTSFSEREPQGHALSGVSHSDSNAPPEESLSYGVSRPPKAAYSNHQNNRGNSKPETLEDDNLILSDDDIVDD